MQNFTLIGATCRLCGAKTPKSTFKYRRLLPGFHPGNKLVKLMVADEFVNENV